MVAKPKFFFFNEIDSTSTFLRRFCDKYPSGTVVSAEFQTAGRGRGTNEWKCNSGAGAMFSILLDRNPQLPIERISHLALEVAEIIVGWLLTEYQVKAEIKLPNDILFGGKKLCGILVEEVGSKIVIGIGLNTNSAPTNLSKEYEATSLVQMIPEVTDVDNTEIVKSLASRVIAGLQPDFDKQGIEE